MIALGCDHGGFALKKELISFIDSLGYETIDIGCYDENSVGLTDLKGLGLYPGILICHYSAERREHLNELLAQDKYSVRTLTDEDVLVFETSNDE